MANIDKIIKSKYQPKQTNVAWVDLSGEIPVEKHFINGRWVAVSGGGGGSSIVINPDEEATETLHKIKADGTVYDADISGKADKIPVSYSIPNDGMLPNVLYNFGELSSNTTFTLAAATDNTVMNVWRWKFSTGNTVPTIILPSGLAWKYGEEPVFEPNQTYLIVVTEGIATCISTAGVNRLINGILFGLLNGLPSLRVEELTIARKLDAYIKEGNALTSGAGAPIILPQYNGQEYFDTTNKVWYKASYTGTEPTASAWKQITN